MTFSEFGRRAKENGSKGTDHGSAAPMFLVGGKVKRGVVGEHPSLTKLEDGNLDPRDRLPPGLRGGARPVARRASKDVLGAEFKPVEVFAKRG